MAALVSFAQATCGLQSFIFYNCLGSHSGDLTLPFNSACIRQLEPADHRIFYELRMTALQTNPESFGATPGEFAAQSQEERQRQLNGGDDSFVLGAFQDEKLVGLLGFFRRKGEKLRHKGVIWGVYVLPEARRKGLARALLTEALQKCRPLEGLEAVLLTVVSSNQSARALYESMGFAAYGQERAALKIGETTVDEDLMELVL